MFQPLEFKGTLVLQGICEKERKLQGPPTIGSTPNKMTGTAEAILQIIPDFDLPDP
jgi:hypothetical protein